MIQVTERVLQFRGWLVSSFALLPSREEPGGITLIDGGFLSHTPEGTLAQLETLGWSASDIESILLTHGHIDHTRNLHCWKELTNATLYAPRGDERHIDGTFPYRGPARICGTMELTARAILRYRAPEVDRWFAPGDMLPTWGGLEVIPLPGHTLGHSGFYSPQRKLLFAGDLYSSYFHRVKIPPRWLNVSPDLVVESLHRAAALDLEGGVLLSHAHAGTPQEHREDLVALASRV